MALSAAASTWSFRRARSGEIIGTVWISFPKAEGAAGSSALVHLD